MLGMGLMPAVSSLACTLPGSYPGPAPDTHTGCPADTNVGAYPQELDMSHFVNFTGVGYDFEIFSVELTNNIVVAGIPAGATIVQAYLWHVEKSAACPATINFNG